MSVDLDKNYVLLSAVYFPLLLYKTGSFLLTQEFAGRDLVGAYSLVKTFEIGWNTEWFLGFPMFQFYPPGFFGATSFLGSLIGDQIAFKILVYLTLLVFPLTAYYCFKILFNRQTGLIAGSLGIFVVFLREPFSLIYQTLQVGLVAQAAALPLLFVFIALLWKNSRDSAYLSALTLGAIILIHPYIGVLAVVYLGIYFLLSKNIFQSFMASLGILMSAWWWIPALENSWYMQSYVGPTGQLVNWPWLFLPFLGLKRSKKSISLSLIGLTCLILGTFSFGPEIQHYRFFIYGQILVIISSAPGIYWAVEELNRKLPKSRDSLLLALIGLSLVLPVANTDIDSHWESDTDLNGVIPDSGRIVVETSHTDLHQSYVPIQTIPLRSNTSVVNGLYADGSISSPYLLGLEKSFAENPVPNPLAVDANLTQEQIQNRMKYFNITHALVSTDSAREKLGFMSLEAENEDYMLLSWKPEPSKEIKAAKICINHQRWGQVNRFIFKNEDDLNEVVPVLDCEEGEKINQSGPKSVIEKINKMEKSLVNLTRESITPKATKETLFHLRTNR